MQKYEVKIEEILQRTVKLKAESKEEAICLVKEKYINEKIVLTSILNNNIENPDNIFVVEDKSKFLISINIIDTNTNEIVGKVTLTFITRDNVHEIVDIDITLSNDKIKVLFEEKYDESSESNEYYHVSYNDVHFEI